MARQLLLMLISTLIMLLFNLVVKWQYVESTCGMY